MPSGESTVPRGEQTRRAILDAAERLFLSNGFNGTSMRQIAQEAGGIAVGGIYNHFGSKEDIFRALLAARSPYPRIIEIVDSLDAPTGQDLLRQAFIRLQKVVIEDADFFSLIMIDMREFRGDTIRGLMTEVIPHMIRFGAQAKAAGGIRQGVETILLIRCLAMLMLGYMFTQMVAFSQGRNLLAEMADLPDKDAGYWESAIMDAFLYGVAEREDRP
jgi:AcrR family transcriptional regulator